MIKNVIFDINKVLRKLIHVEIDKFLSKQAVSKLKNKSISTSRELIRYIFTPEVFLNYDLGLISRNEVIKRLSKSCGECEMVIKEAMDARIDKRHNKIFAEMLELNQFLRSRGVKTFILSNMGADLAKNLTDWLGKNNFDDIIFSCDVHMVKPNREIFELALKRFNISASETLFVDDLKANLDAFASLGVKGYLFDYKNLDSEIESIKNIVFK